MNPTQHLRAVARQADPDYSTRKEYKLILRAARLRLSDWLLTIHNSRYAYRAVGRTHYDEGRVTITLGCNTPWPAICALLLHEVAHASLANHWPRVHHDDKWRSKFLELAWDVYGVDVIAFSGSSHDLHAAIQGALS